MVGIHAGKIGSTYRSAAGEAATSPADLVAQREEAPAGESVEQEVEAETAAVEEAAQHEAPPVP